MKHEFSARPVCFLALVKFRYLKKKFQYQFTCDQIISELRKMYFLRLKDTGYTPAYTGNDLTDALHEAFVFRTDN